MSLVLAAEGDHRQRSAVSEFGLSSSKRLEYLTAHDAQDLMIPPYIQGQETWAHTVNACEHTLTLDQAANAPTLADKGMCNDH